MTRREPRAIRVRAVLAACLLGILAALGPLAPAATVPSATAAPGDVTVEITGMTPAVLRPGLDLVVTGTITNETGEVLTDPTVRLRMQSRVPESRNSLDRWLEGEATAGLVSTLTLANLGQDVAPGASAAFTVSIPSDQSPFGGSPAWGPRGIEIVVSDAGETWRTRSELLWYPETLETTARTEVTVLLPLTPTAQEWAAATQQDVLVGQVAAPRITALVEATRDLPVAWALDPVLLELPVGSEPTGAEPGEQDPTTGPADDGAGETTDPATVDPPGATDGTDPTDPTPTDPTDPTTTPGATDPGTEPTPSGTPTDPAPGSGADPDAILTATDLPAFVQSLAAASAQRDVVALSYADADAVTLAESEDTTIADAAADRAARLFEEREVVVLDDVIWPAATDAATLEAIARSGAQTVVLPADEVPTTGDLTYTPSGRTEISTSGGEVEAALWDGPLSRSLTDPDLTAVEARQSFLAQTAVVTRERPNDARGLLAALPRDLGADPGDAERLRAILGSLAEAPWLEVTSLRSLLGRSAGTEGRSVQVSAPEGDRLTGAELRRLGETWTSLDAFNDVLAEPGALTNAPAVGLLSAPATALIERTQIRSTLVDGATAAVADLLTQISVQAGSSVLLISDASEVPVTIDNAMDADASVVVQLDPSDPRLRADDGVAATIPANGTTTVRVPVTAVASGDVTVEVLVLAAEDGTSVAQPSSFDVRVRPDWESTGLTAAVVVLGVAFVFGLIRTIRKGGRRYPPEAAEPRPAATDTEDDR
ncbi:hypothetical protein EXU48_00685 [Occultella glacieicola]|uniref:Uncharacterized protein n=1 Tax=Occultella glacieicola TaxID=2518684 RepID=A0ABY2E8B8_9MICO|nr:DUF6049 family protein [Occultella glacieicola]TDE98756.1 hypothetical protein EXU48_00685 [Occultella glacieicola]